MSKPSGPILGAGAGTEKEVELGTRPVRRDSIHYPRTRATPLVDSLATEGREILERAIVSVFLNQKAVDDVANIIGGFALDGNYTGGASLYAKQGAAAILTGIGVMVNVQPFIDGAVGAREGNTDPRFVIPVVAVGAIAAAGTFAGLEYGRWSARGTARTDAEFCSKAGEVISRRLRGEEVEDPERGEGGVGVAVGSATEVVNPLARLEGGEGAEAPRVVSPEAVDFRYDLATLTRDKVRDILVLNHLAESVTRAARDGRLDITTDSIFDTVLSAAVKGAYTGIAVGVGASPADSVPVAQGAVSTVTEAREGMGPSSDEATKVYASKLLEEARKRAEADLDRVVTRQPEGARDVIALATEDKSIATTGIESAKQWANGAIAYVASFCRDQGVKRDYDPKEVDGKVEELFGGAAAGGEGPGSSIRKRAGRGDTGVRMVSDDHDRTIV